MLRTTLSLTACHAMEWNSKLDDTWNIKKVQITYYRKGTCCFISSSICKYISDFSCSYKKLLSWCMSPENSWCYTAVISSCRFYPCHWCGCFSQWYCDHWSLRTATYSWNRWINCIHCYQSLVKITVMFILLNL